MGRYDGDGSYQRLIANVYGMNKTNAGLTQSLKEYNTIRIDEFVLQLSILFLRTGVYYHNTGRNGDRSFNGFYWENKTYYGSNGAYDLVFDPTNFNVLGSQSRGFGLSVRCEAK